MIIKIQKYIDYNDKIMDFVFHYHKITTITDQSDKFGQRFF